jgi:large repetitive protein
MRSFAYWLVPFVAVSACGDHSSTPHASPDGPIMPACSDQRDNDGDGLIDYPNDPGCTLPQEDSEDDDCPDGASCPQCSDGKDNDGNGRLDFPNDPGCTSAGDSIEFTLDPTKCGPGTVIKPLPANGMDHGGLFGTTSMVESPCGGGNGLPGIAYVFHVLRPTVVTATTDDPQTVIDTILDLRAATCSDEAAELACNDDVVPNVAANKRSTLTRVLGIGTYYLFVHGKTAADTGMYALRVTFEPGEGAKCSLDEHCGPALVCRVPVGETDLMCTGPVCSDGRDDDGDGKIDFPVDPGCTSATDDDESDGCSISPTHPMCPECGNGLDDDGDGLIDYPADPSCKSASSNSEACTQSETVGVITQMITTGTTVGAVNDATPSCNNTSSHTAPDLAYRLDLPPMATLSLNLTGFDTVHSLLGSTCGGTPIACSDPALMTRTNVAAGRYYVIIDGWGSNSGAWTLTTTGTVSPGGSCEGSLFQSGAFTCTSGYACNGTPGSRTCSIARCSDMQDNDGDGKIDYPADPGCESTSDNDETDDCFPTVGPSCPACSDGIDNDGDGLIDYPADPSCIAASSRFESCQESDPILVATGPQISGTTVGAVNDYRPPPGSVNNHACSTTGTHSAPDRIVQLDVPALASLALNLSPVGYDSTHVLLPGSCLNPPIDCSDSPNMTVGALAAGRYYVVIDGYSSGSGTFTLNISGEIQGGESCESPLAQSGALTCADGYACQGALGSRTCAPAACNDGIDNDGDGKIDFPADPGCASRGDSDETDDCYPTVGPACPACANGIDDDMNTFVDYPADARCPSASFFLEGFCSMEAAADIAGMVLTPVTIGTLAGKSNNYNQSCQSSTGNDITYGLRLPVPVASLRVDTVGSMANDTVLSIWDAACLTSLGCNDDGAGLQSVITLSNVAAGDYAIQVDSYGSTNNSGITLNVKGTVAAGTACTHELFATGVLVCPASTSCIAGTCQ